jgi:hypothetical protein
MRHMDLDLDLFRGRGRANVPLTFTVLGELDEADLRSTQIEKGSKTPPLKRITDRHHALARNLASGMGESEAAHICGICRSRVSILKNDPAFQELLTFYREAAEAKYADMHMRLANLSSDAVQLLSDRLEDDPDSLSINQLIEVTKMGADRTGFGPQSSSTNLNVNVGVADRLEEARKRVRARRLATIEGSLSDE